MSNTKKEPIEWELNFDHTQLRELNKKLLSGEITFEEWKKESRRDLQKLSDD